MDSSSRSLKAVLLQNGNTYPSLPIAHCVSKRGVQQFQDVAGCIEMLFGAKKTLNSI